MAPYAYAQGVIDSILRNPHSGAMEVRFDPELQAKLNRLATEQGRDSEARGEFLNECTCRATWDQLIFKRQ
jgi:hypothetical protein